MRATLSAGHQKAGSSFTVETPNALPGDIFSPVIEVSMTRDQNDVLKRTPFLIITA